MSTHLFLIAFLFLAQLANPVAESLRTITSAITRGATFADRKAAVAEQLKTWGIAHEVQSFSMGARTGENIVVTLPGRTQTRSLLLGAHLDRVPVGEGAVDNGASCAVLLELLRRLKESPLQSTITVVFFDLEEAGLVGSREYFRTVDVSKRPSKAINLDIFGYGDTLFLTSSLPDGPLERAFREATTGSAVKLRTVPMAQYPASDHRSMAAAGIESLGLALIDGAEIDSIVGRGGAPPRILTIIHSPSDTMEQIRERDMAAALPVLEKAIRLIDGLQ